MKIEKGKKEIDILKLNLKKIFKKILIQKNIE